MSVVEEKQSSREHWSKVLRRKKIQREHKTHLKTLQNQVVQLIGVTAQNWRKN